MKSNEGLSIGYKCFIPPDPDISIWDRSLDSPLSFRSYVELAEVRERILNSVVFQGSVKSLMRVCDVIDVTLLPLTICTVQIA